jgi:hypothetical protein
MQRELNVYYDTRLAPLTFDFGSYLVVADAERQRLQLDTLSIHIFRPSFRNKTVRENEYSNSVKDWRFKHIILGLANLIPSTASVRWTATSHDEIRFPNFPLSYPPRSQAEASSCIPYLSNSLLKYKGSAINLLPFKARVHAVEIVKGLLGNIDGPIVTITLRTSNQQIERNSDIRAWNIVYKDLVSRGYNVLVIPDFEDATSTKKFLEYNWKVFLPAVYDLDLRLAIYSLANMNMGVLNGILVPLFHSTYPYLLFKPNVESVHQTKVAWLRDVFGIEKGESFWWSKEKQQLSWELDNNPDRILECFDNLIGENSNEINIS